MQDMNAEPEQDRRERQRFSIRRELRYTLLKDGVNAESGVGETIDIGSGGVGFSIGRPLPAGRFIELSISWPMLLDDTCPMRLVVFGRVLRNEQERCACTIDKYEFRTQSRTIQPLAVRNDSLLRRWAETVRKEPLVRRRDWAGTADHGGSAASIGGELWRAAKPNGNSVPRPASKTALFAIPDRSSVSRRTPDRVEQETR